MSRRYKIALVFGFLIFVTAYICLTFSGYYFYDDYTYAEYAHQMQEGTFRLQYDTFSHRLAFILPIVAIYAVAGIHDFSTILWPLLCTLGTLALLLRYLQSDSVLCLFAVAATALNSYFLFFCDKLFPDTPLTFFLLAAGIVAERYRVSQPIRSGLGTIVLVFIAFMTKETAMYATPFFTLLIGYAYRKEGAAGRRFAVTAAVTGSLLAALYFGGYYISTGNPLYRFTSIVGNHYVHSGSYYDKPFSILLSRLTYAPWIMFLECGLLVAILPGLVVAVYLIFRRKALQYPMLTFWAWYGIWMLTAFWFGSTSTRYYSPLSLSPRMYFPLLPVFAIPAAWYWRQAVQSAYARVSLSFLFALAALASLLLHSKYTYVYVGLAMLPLLYYLRIREEVTKRLVGALFAGILLTVPVYRMLHPQQWGYQAEKKIFAQYLNGQAGSSQVVTDERLAVTYPWYYRFQPPGSHKFVDFSQASPTTLATYQQAFVLFNPHTFRNSPLSLEPWENWER